MRFHLGWVMPGTLLGVQRFGWAGVDLFFVLSGFLIGSQLFKAHAAGEPILWPFYRRRMFRILPAYLVVLALYFAWPAWREFGPLAPLWQYLTFTENLLYDASWNHSFSHVWSLCIEEQFYLVLPLMLLALSRRPSFRRTSLILASFVVAGIVVRTWVLIHQLQPLGPDAAGADYMEHIYYPTYSRMDGLLAGVALTALALWLFRDRWESETGSAAWGTCVGFPLLSLGLALVVASAVSQNGWLRLKIPGAALLASLAYSLYLTHKAAAHLAHTFLPQWTPGPTPVTFLVVAASCLGVAALRCRTPLHGPPRSHKTCPGAGRGDASRPGALTQCVRAPAEIDEHSTKGKFSPINHIYAMDSFPKIKSLRNYDQFPVWS